MPRRVAAAPLLRALEREARRTREGLTDGQRGALGMLSGAGAICARAGVDVKTSREWRTDGALVMIDTADRMLLALDLLWWDVWSAENGATREEVTAAALAFTGEVPEAPRRQGRALLVGEAPGRASAPGARPLDGAAGDRLAGYAGMTRAAMLERFDAVNLLSEWPGGQGKGSRWPVDEARAAAVRAPLRGVVVLLGGRVAQAYRFDAPFGEWRRWPRALVCAVPHPSGVNRLYNYEAARVRAGEVLMEAERFALEEGAPPPQGDGGAGGAVATLPRRTGEAVGA